jgi:hypothetical protein
LGVEGEDCDLGGAVEAEGQAYGADASVNVELHVVKVVVAFGVDTAERGQYEGAEEGEADLASVGVAGQDEVDELCPGVLLNGEGVVRLVGHKDDGCSGIVGYGKIEVRVTGAWVLHTCDPDAVAVALYGEVAVVEDGDSIALEGVDDGGRAYAYVMISEDGEAQGAGDGGEEFRATVGGMRAGDEGKGTYGHEVSGEEDEVWIKGVNALDDFPEEVRFGEFI